MTVGKAIEAHINPEVAPDPSDRERMLLRLGWADYKWPLFFLLTTSALGLYFPLAYLLLPIILINRFRNDKYDFIIMLTIICGDYGMTSAETFKVNPYYVVYVIAIIGILIFRKTILMRKIIVAWVVYVAILFCFALMSEETMKIQFRRLMPYQAIIYFLVPMMVFAGRDFDIMTFFRRVMPYCLIMCLWYILDGMVFGGWIMLPHTFMPWDSSSTFLHPIILGPSFFPRKYPPGLYILTLALFPVVRYYKLSWKQWALIILAFVVCRTFSIIAGFLIVALFLQGHIKKLLKYGAIAIVTIGALYAIDTAISREGDTEGMNGSGTTLRIKSSVDQIIGIGNIQDEEDLAKLGTGRMAQAIPKLELLYELHREWIGFGFLDEDRTTMTKYIIYNPLYLTSDVFKRDEVATGVEITVIQHILNIGYIGLCVVIAFYSYICFLVRHLRYRFYFYSVLLCFIIFGVAGFSGLIYAPGLLLIGLSLACILLDEKSRNTSASPIS